MVSRCTHTAVYKAFGLANCKAQRVSKLIGRKSKLTGDVLQRTCEACAYKRDRGRGDGHTKSKCSLAAGDKAMDVTEKNAGMHKATLQML
jgi:hypothetical protein